jgi:hypothetical protein
MHRHRIVAQISLILSILNLVLAAPIVVQEIHDARGDKAEGVPGMPNESDELEATSDRPTSPHPSQDAMLSPQHSSLSDGSTSSGHPTPYLSSDSSVSGYSWLLDRPPRLSPYLPASLHDPESTSLHPSSGSMQIAPGQWLGLAPEEIPPSPPSPGSMSEPYSPESGGSLSSHNFPASDRLVPSHHSMPEGLAPSHHLTTDGPPPLPSPPTETPPDNAESFKINTVEKLKIAAAVTIVGGAIASIAGLEIKHLNSQDS